MHSSDSPPSRHQNSSVSKIDVIGPAALAGARGAAPRHFVESVAATASSHLRQGRRIVLRSIEAAALAGSGAT
jgi:hypothetical protein